MTTDPQQKFPREKSPEYMRKAYLYTGILMVICLIGAVILANRITTAEAAREAMIEQAAQEEPSDGAPAEDPADQN